jgi:hypothetical protein
MDSVHRWQVSYRRCRDAALRQIDQRRSRREKEVAQTSRTLMAASKNGGSSAPEVNGVPAKDLPSTALVMATDRQIAANRRNGALSRGPKTPAGKARSSRNAFKHGLSIAVTRDKARSRRIEVLARKLAQSEAGHLLAQARVAAEAEVELGRVRAAFEAVLAHAAGSSGRGEGAEGAAALTQALPELEKLDRYERRALSKRRRALRGL